MTLALLNAVLYPNLFEHPTISIPWGKDNEDRASQEYLKYVRMLKVMGKRICPLESVFILLWVIDLF